jgi:hypothetical protein
MRKRYVRDGKVQYVAAGFSWFCFFFSALWAMWNSNWTAFWAYAFMWIGSFVVGYVGGLNGHDLTSLCSFVGFCYHVVVCTLANAWLEGSLKERGWVYAGDIGA